jgi:hypothetical protein
VAAQIVGVIIAAGDQQSSRSQHAGDAADDEQWVASIGDQPGEPIGHIFLHYVLDLCVRQRRKLHLMVDAGSGGPFRQVCDLRTDSEAKWRYCQNQVSTL